MVGNLYVDSDERKTIISPAQRLQNDFRMEMEREIINGLVPVKKWSDIKFIIILHESLGG